MTDDDVDTLPFDYGDVPQRAGLATPKCARHRWDKNVLPADAPDLIRCSRCHHVQDPAKVKAGRTSRQRGGRHELHVARMYGGTKVGHHGGPADVFLGDLFAVQLKTHQGPPPVVLLRLLAALETGAGGRIPVVLHRYLQPGKPAVDLFTLRGSDWVSLHGKDGTE